MTEKTILHIKINVNWQHLFYTGYFRVRAAHGWRSPTSSTFRMQAYGCKGDEKR